MTELTHELINSVFHQATSWNKNFLALMKKWHRNSTTRRQLKDLPEHLLKDIGIDKRSAEKEVNKPWWK